MEHDILSPLSRKALAEQALLKYLRDNGVFDPPSEGQSAYGMTMNQNIRTDMLLHAVVKFCVEKYRNPLPVVRILAEEIKSIV